jgi:hypothetical protein
MLLAMNVILYSCLKYKAFAIDDNLLIGTIYVPSINSKISFLAGENRICKLCEYKDIGGEFHNVFKCTDICIQNARVIYLPKYCHKNPNILKFQSLFNVTNKTQLMKICKILGVIMERVSCLG